MLPIIIITIQTEKQLIIGDSFYKKKRPLLLDKISRAETIEYIFESLGKVTNRQKSIIVYND